MADEAPIRINLVSPENKLVSVDSSEALRAVNEAGYKVPTEADYKEYKDDQKYGDSIENSVKAFGAAAARGASFGTSDYLLPMIPGGPTKETLSQLQKRHEIASPLGETAGVVGSSILLPEGGLVGLAGKAANTAGELAVGRTATSALSKIGGAAVGNAVHGAFYGTGKVLSEDALGDPGLTGQKVWSQIGFSALLSGALGGALKAGEMALPSVANTAKDIAGKAFDKTSSVVSGLPEEEVAAMRLNRGVGEAVKGVSSTGGILSDIAPEVETKLDANSIAEKLLQKFTGQAGQGDKLLNYGAVGMAAKAMGVPTKTIGAVLGAYEALKHPEVAMNRLANLENIVQKATQSITSNANAIFKGGLEGATQGLLPLISSKIAKGDDSKEVLSAEYQKAVEKINDVSSHPDRFIQVMNDATEALYPHAPKVTGQIQQTAGTALQFLQTKIPKPTNQAPLSEPYQPSPSDMGKFMHYYEVVNNPIDSLKELRMGTLSPDTIETLQAVHPKLYEDMRSQLLDKVMENKGKIPYQTKSALSMFLQEPLDESMRPSSMLLTQTAYAMPSKSENAKVPQMGSTGSGSRLAKLNVAGRARTGTQKVNLGQKL